MVQLFVRGARPGTTCIDVESDCSVSGLMCCIEACTGIPVDHQGLVFGGRQLDEMRPLQSYGITAGSTVQLVYRLLGGKGGFGALLRGQGRDGKVTDNYDACRDLSGRRLRHKTAEEKLAAWKAEAKERELEAIALKHLKEEARKARKQAAEEVDVEAIRSAQEEALTRTQKAVQDALKTNNNAAANRSATAATTLTDSSGSPQSAGTKRKADDSAAPQGGMAAAKAAPPAKKSKMLACLEDVGSEESSEEEDA